MVKNITDYGAFIDLGGIDGLLHVTDMAGAASTIRPRSSMSAIRQSPDHPYQPRNAAHLARYEAAQADPWEGIEAKYPVGGRFTGTVTNIADYGAFVELEPGVEGLIHVSEMSWTKKNVHPGKIVSTSQEVDVQVLEVDPEQAPHLAWPQADQDNPWDAFLAEHPTGSTVEGSNPQHHRVRSVHRSRRWCRRHGPLVGHLDWNKSGDEAIKDYNKGDEVRPVLDVDSREGAYLARHQAAGGDPLDEISKFKKNDATVTCTVTSRSGSGGIEVAFGRHRAIKSFIKRSDLSRDRADQRPERFAVGDKVDAKVIQVDRGSRRVSLSIKALEIAEEAEAVAQYGSADAGASLGDILGAALASSGSAKEDAAPAAASGDADANGRLAAPQGDADDLKQIKGVGPAFEKKLNDAGVFHFWQIASMTDDQLAALEEEVGTSGKGADWKAEAAALQG
jgi:small subunit ribosomal protein S1